MEENDTQTLSDSTSTLNLDQFMENHLEFESPPESINSVSCTNNYCQLHLSHPEDACVITRFNAVNDSYMSRMNKALIGATW